MTRDGDLTLLEKALGGGEKVLGGGDQARYHQCHLYEQDLLVALRTQEDKVVSAPFSRRRLVAATRHGTASVTFMNGIFLLP
jgi:hypothetical protein